MTENQTNAIVKNPNTKKAIAILQRFALTEAAYKAAEKESKAAAELIKQAMIDQGIEKVNIDMPGLTGFITLAERTSYKAEDLDEVGDEFKKFALDTDKVKAQATLTGELPAGVVEIEIKLHHQEIQGRKIMPELNGEPHHIKLWNLPQRVEGGVEIHGVKDTTGKDVVILFHHLDGMYSYCTLQNPEAPGDMDGEPIHLSASTPIVEIGDGKYKIDDEPEPLAAQI